MVFAGQLAADVSGRLFSKITALKIVDVYEQEQTEQAFDIGKWRIKHDVEARARLEVGDTVGLLDVFKLC